MALEYTRWCGACRTVYRWEHSPEPKHACCPKAGCGLPLGRTPQLSSRGKHEVSSQRPLDSARPA
jgi:hypothetical protein